MLLSIVLLLTTLPTVLGATDNPLIWTEEPELSLDFEETYLYASNGKPYYDNTAENWSASNNRGSTAEMATETNGNHAVRLTYDNEYSNENYNANAVLNIYNPSTKTKFIGTVGVTYTISFDYKVENTDNKNLQLFIAPSNREYNQANYYAFKGTDLGPRAVIRNRSAEFTEATDIITETTDWVRTSVKFTTPAPIDGYSVFPIILLQTNGKTKDPSATGNYASVLIDNIKVEPPKTARVTCYNYDGNDKALYIYDDTQFADLIIPSRKGWIFEGWYTDSSYTKKADNGELVGNYGAIYAKWSGNGEAMTPYKITNSFDADAFKITSKNLIDTTLNEISYVQNSMIDMPGSVFMSDFYGSYVFSSKNMVDNSNEKLVIDSINANNPTANTVLFYVELPDFEKVGANWGLALGDRGICLYQNSSWIWTNIYGGNTKFDYSLNNKWIESTLSSDGIFTGLPSGYKGYIRIDLSDLNYTSTVDLSKEYIFNCLELRFNALGGENGNAVLGGLLYFPKTKSESTVMQINGLYYELSKSSEAISINTYDVKSETNSNFSVRYTGTTGQAAVKYADNIETSAFWAKKPVAITTISGKAETTSGYMTTYINSKADVLMQPGVDSIMFYVEIPVFEQNNTRPALKFIDSKVKQGDKTATLSFANSLYAYANINDASWKIARAGADGDLFDITSGFKGYIKFNIKQFKNISDVKALIDFTNTYYVTSFELGFNHIGGENGDLIIGGLYSVIEDSNSPFIKNGITSDKRCFKVIPGDFDCNGTYNAEELVLMRRTLLGISNELDPSAKLRENFDIRTLVRAKKTIAGASKADTSVNTDNGAVYKEMFTEDYVSDNSPILYWIVNITDYAAKIEADTTLNNSDKAIAFANEINNNKVGDFEKIGIDKMCHVSTFLYAKGNIYISYYANTISAAEDPQYQVARFAYAPENDTNSKVILDIMQVGDDLYGHKVTGVYDTILMQKEDDPNNIYILWTASVNGKYYRLYRTFNLETEELGEIGVNRFKVGNVINDFSSTGITNALAANKIGYKQLFSDIGIMQKLSSRIENGERYYYTGAYSGNFTCIIKSKDLITWEYVAQPNEGANGTGFANATKWENAVYVLGDKVYYFVRQWDPDTSTDFGTNYGILTSYDLITGEWTKPVLVGDCQSRSDFIYYKDNLYLFYAPTDRQHIGILKINTDDISKTEVVLQANMGGSCFYPFVQYNSSGELCMSYTVDRQHIRLASFTLSDYID